MAPFSDTDRSTIEIRHKSDPKIDFSHLVGMVLQNMKMWIGYWYDYRSMICSEGVF